MTQNAVNVTVSTTNCDGQTAVDKVHLLSANPLSIVVS